MKIDGSNRNHVDLSSSSPLEPAAEIVSAYAGGEMERLRQVMLENRLAQIKEAEHRRPDYLKREKRAVHNPDFEVTEKPSQCENDRSGMIGIVDSPNKGRRLTLFQETSEESFEESLMAGGYGRYVCANHYDVNHFLILHNVEDHRVGPSTSTSYVDKR